MAVWDKVAVMRGNITTKLTEVNWGDEKKSYGW